jgi:hypothetical protein
MYADILRSIGGVELFPVISLVVFVTFFTGVLVRVARMTRHDVEHLSRLPLGGAEQGEEASR